jgi:UDP-glucose 4-epimerase
MLMNDGLLQKHLTGKKVLVTGATGFVGSHLVERLVYLGADVVAAGAGLGWRPVVPNLAHQGRVRFIRLQALWSPSSLRRLEPALAGVEYVVHLGYSMPRGNTVLEKALDDGVKNVLGTLQLVRGLPASVSRICFASSASVYGAVTDHPVKETACPHPSTIYAIGKVAAEGYLRQHAEESLLAVAILRYATVYGTLETDPRAIPNFIRQVLAGKSPVVNADGQDTRDYVHVSDVVHATLLALCVQTNGASVYNVGSGRGYTTRDIAERIIRLTGKKLQPVYKPEGQPSDGVVCNISRAHSDLGYQPQVDLEDGLRDEIKWFRKYPRFWRSS